MSTALIAQVSSQPHVCGSEDLIARTMGVPGPHYLPESGLEFSRVRSGCSIALHMHQPLIPAGGADLTSAAVISNLQHMMEHPGVGDNHNAPVFRQCYQRMGQMLPKLIHEGLNPRVMLDYSGTLLHGLRAMGLEEVIASLKTITVHPDYRRAVEWLGTAWGHAVAPSTPVQDFRLHVRAWQTYFADIFGVEALSRVRGFSPPEMALPNQPDVAYEFVKTLKDSGFRWVMVQEHTVERVEDGGSLHYRHIPHRLVARNSHGEEIAITAIIKTQGSDSKLVARMQPYYQAKGAGRVELAGQMVPSLVTQIADGENGGVMMNEFPPKYIEVMREASGSETPAVNVTEYLEYLDTLGIREEDLPAVQPILQKRIWERFSNGAGPEAMRILIATLKREDGNFHMDGGSWTGHISWVHGYENVLGPMEAVSAAFEENIIRCGVPPCEPRYQTALYYLMLTQTSCFRYWGSGIWTEYAREFCRRAGDILKNDS
jgi:hypothetical protein